MGALGAFDTVYYHEYKLKLPTHRSAKPELMLHAYRDFIYALLFGSIGWVTWNGWLTILFAALLITEIVITLADFIVEDRTRKLPPGERVMHALMGIVFGLFLAKLFPNLLTWWHQAPGFALVNYGMLSWLLSVLSLGVFVSGVRDYLSSRRAER